MNSGLILNNEESLLKQVDLWHQQGLKVVFTNGCYDLLHVGHLRLLKEARKQGDVLLVAINTDDSVRRLKGPSRPIMTQQERAEVLAALEMVDAVTFFDEDTPEQILRKVKPDVLVKGGDYRFEEIVGHDFIPAYGGKVIPLLLVDGYSSTKIIDKILRVYRKTS